MSDSLLQAAAFYFDGKTSHRHAVTLQVTGGVARIVGDDVDRSCPLSQLRVSERLERAARKVTYPDGAYLEVQDNAAFAALLHNTPHRDSLPVRIQQNWRAKLVAAAGLIVLLPLIYFFLLPIAVGLIARSLPVDVEQRIGKGSLEFLDDKILEPTALPVAQRTAITARFHSLSASMDDVPPYEIVFRRSRIGPNALALPSGQIVLTDEMVNLLDDDDAVMGVLAHELGHLQQRHFMRRLIQISVIGAFLTMLFGDVSAIIANLPTLLLDMKYSRDVEREADDYAIALFRKNALPRQKLADVFRKLEKNNNNNTSTYLSTHPSHAERVERILTH